MQTPKLKILCYHSVTRTTHGGKWQVPLSRFAQQMRYLVDRGMPVLPLPEAAERLRAGSALPFAVALTFDDGYLDSYQYVLPILRDLGLPATLFVVSGQVRQAGGGAGYDGLRRMGWDELAAWRGAGLSLGVHTLSHPDLRQLSHDALRAEVAEARARMVRHLGGPPSPSFAYPHGLTDARVCGAVRDEGYQCAVSGASPQSCTAACDQFDLRREMVYGDTSRGAFAMKVNPRWDMARLAYWAPTRGGACRAPVGADPRRHASPQGAGDHEAAAGGDRGRYGLTADVSSTGLIRASTCSGALECRSSRQRMCSVAQER